MEKLESRLVRELKARAQRLKPSVKVGHDGLSPGLVSALELELTRQELVKVKFTDFKDQKKELAPQLASQTKSALVMRVGNVAVYYRARAKTGETPGQEKAGETSSQGQKGSSGPEAAPLRSRTEQPQSLS